ncbi:MAG: hypothetical protein ACM3QS_15450, partial [Bacteroidota bacterium]
MCRKALGFKTLQPQIAERRAAGRAVGEHPQADAGSQGYTPPAVWDGGVRSLQTSGPGRRGGLQRGHAGGEFRKYCPLPAERQELMRSAMSQMQLSARAYRRISELAATIADLTHC